MKKTLLTLSILITTFGMAQITITESDFPAPADTAMVSSSDETSLDLVTTGADAVWDFSWINISAQAIDTFHSVQNADLLYQFIFNNSWDNPDHVSDYYGPWFGGGLNQLAQFGMDIEEPVQFTAVHPDRVENTGIGFYLQGNGIPAKSDTIDVQYQLPMDYSDSWTSNSYTNLDLNPSFDAIYRRYQYRNSIVDGWGEITTPWGTFDAVRVKSLVQGIDSVYIGFLSGWYELPTPDQVEYEWWTNGQKMPVFSVVTSDVGGNETITSIRFKDKKRYFVSTGEEMIFEGSVFPNPATDVLHITLASPADLLEVYDVKGRKMYNQVPSSQQLTINTDQWEQGLYILKTTDAKGVSTVKFTVQ